MRLEEHPVLDFARGEAVVFYYNGPPITGFTHETIAAALHAAGIRTLGHSPHLHRPRGLFCAIGTGSPCSWLPVPPPRWEPASSYVSAITSLAVS